MSLLDKASLIVTPNAYKASKLYSVIPSDGTGDITVVRATTATRVNSAGLIESVAVNVPRLDYTNGSCPSLLVEPQRTNLVTYSEQFDNADWTKSGLTITANSFTAPSGNLTADLITPSISDASLRQSFLPTGAVQNTFSVWLRSATGGNFSTSLRCWRDSPFTNVASTVINVTTQWQRFTFTFTSLDSSTHFIAIGADSTLSTGENCYIWGAQLEVGSYATSYIPTVASTVTRNADVISKTGISSLIGQTEGVLFIESAALANDFTSRIISISDGTLNNRIIVNYSPSSNTIQLNVFSGGTAITLINYVVSDTTQFAKIAVRYSNTLGYSLWVNGVNRGSSVSTNIPASMSRLGFDNGSGGTFFVSKIKQVNLYKIALSNTEMATLTTL